MDIESVPLESGSTSEAPLRSSVPKNYQNSDAEVDALLYHQNRTHKLLACLGGWTTQAKLGDKWKQTIKADVARAIDDAIKDIEKHAFDICGLHKGKKLMRLMRDRLDIFRGLRTDRQELALIKKDLPFVELRERTVGPNKSDVAYNIVLAEWVEKMMTYDVRCAVCWGVKG